MLRMQNSRGDNGAIGVILLWLAVAFVFFVLLPFFVFGKIVPPDYIGLRQNYYGIPGVLKKGYEERGLQPGLQWKIPFISTIILFPRTFQLVQLNDTRAEGDLVLPSLDVPTTDGSKVKTDVTLVVRLYESPGVPSAEQAVPETKFSADEVPKHMEREFAHQGLGELVRSYSANRDQQLTTFSSVAQNELRKTLSDLSTIDYYDPILREKAAFVAFDKINSLVSNNGIELWATLIRRYVYVEQNIDDQIFAKNLQDQTERLNAAASKLSEVQAETERQRALWDAKIRDSQVDGQAQASILQSEGDLYEAAKKAEADLLVATSKAQVDSARAQVFSDVQSADAYIAREMTPLLKTLKGGIVSNLDPYDVHDWLRRMLGKSK